MLAAVHDDQPRRHAAGWYPDPLGDHELRYHNGSSWTGDVSTGGERFVAPLPSLEPESRRVGILALTAGVVGMSIGWIPFVCVIGAGLGVVAIVAGIRGRRAAPTRAQSTAGIITGVMALILAAGGLWLSAIVLRAVDRFENPGPYETELRECGEFNGVTEARGTISNLSDRERSYVIEVEFNGEQTADTTVDGLAAGETADFVVAQDFRFTGLDCRISKVTGPLPFGLDVDG
jgi:hypothetical protein